MFNFFKRTPQRSYEQLREVIATMMDEGVFVCFIVHKNGSKQFKTGADVRLFGSNTFDRHSWMVTRDVTAAEMDERFVVLQK
jgi:hypothetical protein